MKKASGRGKQLNASYEWAVNQFYILSETGGLLATREPPTEPPMHPLAPQPPYPNTTITELKSAINPFWATHCAHYFLADYMF